MTFQDTFSVSMYLVFKIVIITFQMHDYDFLSDSFLVILGGSSRGSDITYFLER